MHLADHRESLAPATCLSADSVLAHSLFPSDSHTIPLWSPPPQVPEGKVITLSFRIFDLEADSQCRYDYLDVYNGQSNLVQKLGRFCGTFRPGSLISTTNTMMLEMVTDGETQGRGFVAYYSGAEPYVDGNVVTVTRVSLLNLCFIMYTNISKPAWGFTPPP